MFWLNDNLYLNSPLHYADHILTSSDNWYQDSLLSKADKISDVYMKQEQDIYLTLAGKHQFIPILTLVMQLLERD